MLFIMFIGTSFRPQEEFKKGRIEKGESRKNGAWRTARTFSHDQSVIHRADTQRLAWPALRVLSHHALTFTVNYVAACGPRLLSFEFD